MTTISRQRKWQLRKKALGLCTICGKESTTADYCKKHAKERNERKKAIRIAKSLDKVA